MVYRQTSTQTNASVNSIENPLTIQASHGYPCSPCVLVFARQGAREARERSHDEVFSLSAALFYGSLYNSNMGGFRSLWGLIHIRLLRNSVPTEDGISELGVRLECWWFNLRVWIERKGIGETATDKN
jgi:hypothetical protein